MSVDCFRCQGKGWIFVSIKGATPPQDVRALCGLCDGSGSLDEETAWEELRKREREKLAGWKRAVKEER